MARSLAESLISLFLPGADHGQPIFRGTRKFADDPYWRDTLLFHEYFHAETGQGLGACHQTGWTALVASLIDEWC
jgi:hypothetical protein